MMDFVTYGGLFAISFLAATIFPAQSEIGLSGLIVSGNYSVPLLVVVASVGNTLGSVVNWVIGRGLESVAETKWSPIPNKALDRAKSWYHRYGRWSLLLSWAPFVGDPLTFAAGALREPFLSFLLLVSFAKTARYVVVALLTMGWL